MEKKFKIKFLDNIELHYIEGNTLVQISNSIEMVTRNSIEHAVIKLKIQSLPTRLCEYIKEYITGISHYVNYTLVTLEINKNAIIFDI